MQNKIKNYIESFKNKKVLIVGDVMIDSYMWGNVTRISPEAPIPIVSITEKDYRLGGAANVALNIAALGAKPYLCSVVGNDNYAKIFENILTKNNLCRDGILLDNNRITTVKTRIISSQQHILRVDEEIENNINDTTSSKLLDTVKTIIKKHNIDIIIFEDYDKGVLHKEIIEKIIDISKENNILTSVDPKKKNFNFYKNVDLFKPNFKEFSEGLKIDINKNEIEKLKEHAIQYLSSNNISRLMITLSENGIFISNTQEHVHLPAQIRNIADVSGAGDTVISIASLLMTSHADLKEICQISNIAAGIVCGKVGVVPVEAKEICG